MTAPSPADLRRRLVRAVGAGSSAREAARRLEVSASAAIKLVGRVRETGSAAPAKTGGYRKPLLADHGDPLRELTTAKPGITPAEIQAALTGRGIRAGSPTTIWATLRRLDPRHRKGRWGRSSGIGPTPRPSAAAGGYGSATWTRRASSSSARPGRARTWCAATAGGHGASAWPMPRPTATGAPPPSSPACGAPASSRRSCSTGRWRARRSAPTSSRPSPRPSKPATWWSRTTSPPTRSPVSARRSRPPAPASCRYRPTRRTRTRSSRPLPSRKPACARQAPERDALWNAVGRLLEDFSPSECRNHIANAGYAFD
jgi:transposase